MNMISRAIWYLFPLILASASVAMGYEGKASLNGVELSPFMSELVRFTIFVALVDFVLGVCKLVCDAIALIPKRKN